MAKRFQVGLGSSRPEILRFAGSPSAETGALAWFDTRVCVCVCVVGGKRVDLEMERFLGFFVPRKSIIFMDLDHLDTHTHTRSVQFLSLQP